MTQSAGPVSNEVPTWASEFFAAVDAMHTDSILARLTDDVRVRIGNTEEVRGHDAFASMLEYQRQAIRGVVHNIREVWEFGGSSVLFADGDYTRVDGAVVRLPTATRIHHRSDGLIDELEVFIDPSPITA